jgi:ABC-type dipeptide/oligopeptide/nickel transport system permease subunit
MTQAAATNPPLAQTKPLKVRSLWGDAFHKMLRNRLSIVGLVITSLLLFTAVFGPALAPYNYTEQNLLRPAEGPSRDHLLGTDELGRDLFTRVIYGARTATLVAVFATTMSVLLGMIIGVAAGYLGGWADALIIRIMDIIMSIPSLLLAAMIAATLKQPIVGWAHSMYEQRHWGIFQNTSWLDLVVVFGGLSLVLWPSYARLIRGQILSLREKEYVEAARAVGVPGRQIAMRYLLPNGLGPIVVFVTFSLGGAMVLESSLSFLGIGVMPPQASWGNMIQLNIQSWSYRPWLVFVPAMTLAIVTLGINFLGDGLNDALNPRSTSKSI